MQEKGQRIGLIGTGNLGSALVRGWLRAGVSPLYVFDKDESRMTAWVNDGEAVEVTSSPADLVARADIVFMAVKPADLDALLVSLGPTLSPGQLVVSVAAGVPLDRLRRALGPGPDLCRVMPNLAVAWGEGVLALALEAGSAPAHVESLEAALRAVGRLERIPETLFNVVTAVSSSPAFLALVLEGLEDGAVRAGMPRALARPLVQQTALGAARLLLGEGLSAAELKDRVSSPGGTTIAGLAVLEDRAVRGAFLRAIEAADQRGRELGS